MHSRTSPPLHALALPPGQILERRYRHLAEQVRQRGHSPAEDRESSQLLQENLRQGQQFVLDPSDKWHVASNFTPPERAKLLTPEELSEYLGVPRRTLDSWRSRRRGPVFLRVGVHVRYRQEDVDAYVHDQLLQGRHWMNS